MVINKQEYRRLALNDGDNFWELHDGELVGKPPMAFAHRDVIKELGHVLRLQSGRERYRVRVNMGRVRHTSSYYVPDLFVVPIELTAAYLGAPEWLEVYDRPLPLVVEARSPLMGRYDVEKKLPE
jgi:Uma2 family endonuclease